MTLFLAAALNMLLTAQPIVTAPFDGMVVTANCNGQSLAPRTSPRPAPRPLPRPKGI